MSNLHTTTAKELYFSWINHVENATTAEEIVSLYLDNSILIPTFSPDLCVNKQQKIDYFQNLLTKKNIKITTEKLICQDSSACLVCSGLYTFHYTDQNRRFSRSARFTFIFKKNQDTAWQILHHHSSELPN